MTQNRKPQTQHKETQLPTTVIEKLIKTQQLTALNEAENIKLKGKELDLKSKELELNSRYAEKALDAQSNIISNKPIEGRKTITRIAYIIGAFVTVFLSFVGFCLYIGKEQFVIQFIQIIGYFVTTALGYYFGKSNKNSNDRNDTSITGTITDAEVIP